MNFLMHIFLSKEDFKEMTGNFIGDLIKAGRENDFEEKIRRGIILHRKIDAFSDKNFVFKKSKRRFPYKLQRFSPIAVDIIYDHFLAKHFKYISGIKLKDFLDGFYLNFLMLNLKLKKNEYLIINRIIQENWMYHYQDIEYSKKVIIRLSNRLKRENSLSQCAYWFEQYYLDFEKDFFEFLPEVQNFVYTTKNELL